MKPRVVCFAGVNILGVLYSGFGWKRECDECRIVIQNDFWSVWFERISAVGIQTRYVVDVEVEDREER